MRLICRVGTCCPRVVPRQPETARATSILPAATGVACISFYVGRLFVRVVCGFRLPQRCGTRGQRVPTLLPTSVFYATGIVCNSSMYALFISFAVLNSRMVDKVGRVSTHKVCGFQAALRLICRVGTCCPRVVPRQPETARATNVLPAVTGVVRNSFYVNRLFVRVVCGFRLPQRCGTRGQQVPTLLPASVFHATGIKRRRQWRRLRNRRYCRLTLQCRCGRYQADTRRIRRAGGEPVGHSGRCS